MNDLNRGHEYEFEPQFGLPEVLPSNERVIWQGSPDWRAMARHVFHLRKLTVYFGVLIGLRVFVLLVDGEGPAVAATSALWLLTLSTAAMGMLALMAYFSARTTVYTITNRRIVMRVGIVLTLTFNFPMRCIASAGFRALSRSTADIPLQLMGSDKIAYLHLWPHARPWRYARPEPMLRCVPEGRLVADILARAWSEDLQAAGITPKLDVHHGTNQGSAQGGRHPQPA